MSIRRRPRSRTGWLRLSNVASAALPENYVRPTPLHFVVHLLCLAIFGVLGRPQPLVFSARVDPAQEIGGDKGRQFSRAQSFHMLRIWPGHRLTVALTPGTVSPAAGQVTAPGRRPFRRVFPSVLHQSISIDSHSCRTGRKQECSSPIHEWELAAAGPVSGPRADRNR